MRKIFVFVFLVLFFSYLNAQTDSLAPGCGLRISLLTCSPGEELYTSWGHSALRVIDSSANTDLVYNYGTFDFDDPSFYSKFIRGKLLYYVSVDAFKNFVEEYTYYQRGITEQVLNLDCAEEKKLAAALNENAKEENKYYLYDFTYDNCTTRLRDMVFRNAGGAVITRSILNPKRPTFRNVIHLYLDSSYQYWSKLGIDILLGQPLDRKMTNMDAMFLPDYLLYAFDSTTVNGKRLVNEKAEILKATLEKPKRPLFTPFLVFVILFLIIAILTILKKAPKILAVVDFILFFVSGLLGLILVFMWFGTDHPECRNNFNLAWAFPIHFFIVFFIYQKRTWIGYYFLGNSLLLVALLIAWKWMPQEMNNALLPLVCLLLLRSIVRYKNLLNGV